MDFTCKFTNLIVSNVQPKGNVTWGKTTELNNNNGVDNVLRGSDDSTTKSVKTMGNQSTTTELSDISTMVSNVLDMLASMELCEIEQQKAEHARMIKERAYCDCRDNKERDYHEKRESDELQRKKKKEKKNTVKNARGRNLNTKKGKETTVRNVTGRNFNTNGRNEHTMIVKNAWTVNTSSNSIYFSPTSWISHNP